MAYGLVGKFSAHPGKRDDLVRYLLLAAERLEHDDDCLYYFVSTTDEPEAVWVCEAWVDEAAHEASLEPEEIRALIQKARPLIAAMSNRTQLSVQGGKGSSPLAPPERRPVRDGTPTLTWRRLWIVGPCLTPCCLADNMLSMSTAHLAVYESLADWEAGHLLAELRTGRFTGTPFDVVTVAESLEPVTTMGGLRLLPDMLVGDLDPAASELLILPGAQLWDAGGGAAFADAAARFLAVGVPVAAICGATFGLARAGLLDERRHTSAAAEYLAATGYAGGERYEEARAVADGGLVSAGPDAPVQFARATLALLGLMPETALDAYEGVFARGDARCFPALMEAAASPAAQAAA